MACSHWFVITTKGSKVFPACKLCGTRKLFNNVHRPSIGGFRITSKAVRDEQEERMLAALREAE